MECQPGSGEATCFCFPIGHASESAGVGWKRIVGVAKRLERGCFHWPEPEQVGETNRVVIFDLLLVTRHPSIIPCALQVLAYVLIVYLATRTKVEGDRIVPDGLR